MIMVEFVDWYDSIYLICTAVVRKDFSLNFSYFCTLSEQKYSHFAPQMFSKMPCIANSVEGLSQYLLPEYRPELFVLQNNKDALSLWSKTLKG